MVIRAPLAAWSETRYRDVVCLRAIPGPAPVLFDGDSQDHGDWTYRTGVTLIKKGDFQDRPIGARTWSRLHIFRIREVILPEKEGELSCFFHVFTSENERSYVAILQRKRRDKNGLQIRGGPGSPFRIIRQVREHKDDHKSGIPGIIHTTGFFILFILYDLHIPRSGKVSGARLE